MNGIGGLGAPYWLPDFQSEFLAPAGGSATHVDNATELQQIGAVVESIAFLIAVNVLAMHRATPLQRLTITGGLAACDYLCEVLAEVTQMTVERPTLLEATVSRHCLPGRRPAAGLATRAHRKVICAERRSIPCSTGSMSGAPRWPCAPARPRTQPESNDARICRSTQVDPAAPS